MCTSATGRYRQSVLSSHTQHRALLLVASALLLCVGLGGTDFWAPDEPRYGQVAEEVRAMEQGAKGLVLLHLGGEPYTQKPPLYYWLAALTGSAIGKVTEVVSCDVLKIINPDGKRISTAGSGFRVQALNPEP